MIPERRKEICRDHANWSRVGSTCFARSERTRFMGSVVEDVNKDSGEGKRAWRSVVRVTVMIRYMQYSAKP